MRDRDLGCEGLAVEELRGMLGEGAIPGGNRAAQAEENIAAGALPPWTEEQMRKARERVHHRR